MKKKITKIIKVVFLALFFIMLAFFSYFFIGRTKEAEKIIWGANFSQKEAESLGLNWRDAYLAILDDLKAKKIRISSYWDLIEKEDGKYDFGDLDWQLKESEKRGAGIILAVGMKTPRWPECHIPEWARNQTLDIRNQKLLDYIKAVVERYKNSPAISMWQVENEAFFPFGNCPKPDKELLKKEIDLVKTLDSGSRKVIISDSGEWSLWLKAAKLGDEVGISIYRKVWFGEFGRYFKYPFPVVYYQKKVQLINKFFNKNVLCVELQAEPWGPGAVQDLEQSELEKTMNLEKFRANVEFARKTGLNEFYFWGPEWWYYMKTLKNDPSIWEEAKKLFQN